VLVLLAAAGLVAGPWLALVAARLAARDRAARPSVVSLVGTAVLAGVLAAGAWWVGGARPGTAALVWFAGSALVLGATDLAAHRLPDVVIFPAYAVCTAALVLDAAVLGTWPALVRAVLAAAIAFGVGVLGAFVSPEGLGFGDVKLLGLLGLVLGWAGWAVLMTGIFVGLVVGAAVSLVLLAARRVGWRTAIPFGPPLLVGAAVALAIAAPL
jgi:leader peptidase (prepilin peptidase)/N-methyltransferase